MFYGRRHNGGITPDLRYESVGRGFESLPSHQEKAEHVCVLLFLFGAKEDLNRAAVRSTASNQPSGLLLSPRVPTRRNVYRGSCKSKDFMAFLFFWQSLHTFAHLLHTLQKGHEIFASLAQRVFRCTKKRTLREEHPRQLAALLCVHLPDGFKDHFTRDFCCHRRFVFRGFLRLCICYVLRVEVGFDLLGQLQPGFVLRVSVGVHQDGGGCMAGVALHRFEVTARLQQLVGGTGVAQTVEHDLLKLRVLCPPHTIPLGQNVRGNG